MSLRHHPNIIKLAKHAGHTMVAIIRYDLAGAPGRGPNGHGELRGHKKKRQRQHPAHLEPIHQLKRDRDDRLLDFGGCSMCCESSMMNRKQKRKETRG